MITINYVNPINGGNELIKVYGLHNHPDIGSFYEDLGVDAHDKFLNALEHRCHQIIVGSNRVFVVPFGKVENKTDDGVTVAEFLAWVDTDDQTTLAYIASTAFQYIKDNGYKVEWKDEEKLNVWIRLGGYVTLPKSKINDFSEEDLIYAIKKYGFELCGDTYAPDTLENEELGIKDEPSVEICSDINLTIKEK